MDWKQINGCRCDHTSERWR